MRTGEKVNYIFKNVIVPVASEIESDQQKQLSVSMVLLDAFDLGTKFTKQEYEETIRETI